MRALVIRRGNVWHELVACDVNGMQHQVVGRTLTMYDVAAYGRCIGAHAVRIYERVRDAFLA